MRSVFTDEYDAFRQALVSERKKAGLTQQQVATRLCKPQSFVSKYENGERRLDVIEFLHVAGVLGIDGSSLISQLESKASSGATSAEFRGASAKRVRKSGR